MAATLGIYLGKKQFTIWRREGHRFVPVYGVLEAAREQRAVLQRLWKGQAEALRTGRTARIAGWTVVPLVCGNVVGLVQFAGEARPLVNVEQPILHAALHGLALLLGDDDLEKAERQALPTSAAALLETSTAASLTPAGQPREALSRADAEVDAATQALRAAERRRLISHLDNRDWNVSAVAEELHMGRTKLWEKMRDLAIERPFPAPTDPRRRRIPDPTPAPGQSAPQS